MKIYNSFASSEVKDLYICKSQITRKLLKDLNLPNYFNLDYAKAVFEDCIHKENVIWVYTGSKTDKNKRRLTPFVKRSVYYREFVKGLSYSYKTQRKGQ